MYQDFKSMIPVTSDNFYKAPLIREMENDFLVNIDPIARFNKVSGNLIETHNNMHKELFSF